MNTRELVKSNLVAMEKHYKKGKELTPEEKELLADKEAAQQIVKKCCGACGNAGEDSEPCAECYAIYEPKIKRFWLARYKKAK